MFPQEDKDKTCAQIFGTRFLKLIRNVRTKLKTYNVLLCVRLSVLH